MPKEAEIDFTADKLAGRGMKRELARKNLLECDRYFIEKLGEIL